MNSLAVVIKYQTHDISIIKNHLKFLGDWFDASLRQQSESYPNAEGPEQRLNKNTDWNRLPLSSKSRYMEYKHKLTTVVLCSA